MGQNSKIVKDLYAAFANGDVPGVLGTFESGIEWNEAESFPYADGNPYLGPQAVAEGVFQRIVTDMDGFTVTPENFIDAGETVVVEGRYRGTMKSTLVPVNAQFVHIWHMRDGKIIRFQQYTDTKQWAHAFGS